MGNLEKAGVGVVVVLLGIILGVAFFSNGEQNDRPLQGLKREATNAGNPSDAKQDVKKPPAPPARPADDTNGLPVKIEPGPGEDERSTKSPPPRDDPKPPEKPAPPKPSPVVDPVKPAPKPVVSDWPKKAKVEKSDTSLIAMSRRVYGASQGSVMVPAILKANPSLKPTSMRVGQEVVMPEPSTATVVEKADDKAAVAKPQQKGAPSTSPPSKAATGKAAASRDASKGKKRLAFMPVRGR